MAADAVAESSANLIDAEPTLPELSAPQVDESGTQSSATESLPSDFVSTDDEAEREPLDVKLEHLNLEPDGLSEDLSKDLSEDPPSEPQPSSQEQPITEDDDPLYDDPSDEDDGEGEWITPSNVGLYKSRALQLIPGEDSKSNRRGKAQQIRAGCMTADFAMQNVLLQMSLSLVGVEGRKIERVKTWVLRCHACFK